MSHCKWILSPDVVSEVAEQLVAAIATSLAAGWSASHTTRRDMIDVRA
jgi:hypothetical protein